MTNDEENVWRTLQGKENLAPARCSLFHFHKWSKWKLKDTHTIGKGGYTNNVKILEFSKLCVLCNLEKIHVEKKRLI